VWPPPATGPADRDHVTAAGQSRGAVQRARRQRGLLRHNKHGPNSWRARAPGPAVPAGCPSVSPTPRDQQGRRDGRSPCGAEAGADPARHKQCPRGRAAAGSPKARTTPNLTWESPRPGTPRRAGWKGGPAAQACRPTPSAPPTHRRARRPWGRGGPGNGSGGGESQDKTVLRRAPRCRGVCGLCGGHDARHQGGGGPAQGAAGSRLLSRRSPGCARRGRADGGRNAGASQRAAARPVGPQPRAEGGRTGTPGRSAARKRHFLPGPPPRAAPRGLRRRPRRKASQLSPAQSPAFATALTLSGGENCAASSSSLLSWVEAPRPPESPGLVRPWPWPRLSLVGSQRQSLGVAPPLLQSALPVGLERPSFPGSAPLPGTLPLPLGPAPTLAHPPPLSLPYAWRPTPSRSRRVWASLM
jgi:hypothetical protein